MDFRKEARVQYGFFKMRLESNTRRMEEIPPAELNNLLRTFFIKVRRHDDNPYQPDSIKAMQNSFDRYLSEKGYDASLLRDHVFKGSRLRSRMQSVKISNTTVSEESNTERSF